MFLRSKTYFLPESRSGSLLSSARSQQSDATSVASSSDEEEGVQVDVSTILTMIKEEKEEEEDAAIQEKRRLRLEALCGPGELPRDFWVTDLHSPEDFPTDRSAISSEYFSRCGRKLFSNRLEPSISHALVTKGHRVARGV